MLSTWDLYRLNPMWFQRLQGFSDVAPRDEMGGG
jgi:hypothetical protein